MARRGAVGAPGRGQLLRLPLSLGHPRCAGAGSPVDARARCARTALSFRPVRASPDSLALSAARCCAPGLRPVGSRAWPRLACSGPSALHVSPEGLDLLRPHGAWPAMVAPRWQGVPAEPRHTAPVVSTGHLMATQACRSSHAMPPWGRLDLGDAPSHAVDVWDLMRCTGWRATSRRIVARRRMVQCRRAAQSSGYV